MPAHYMSSQAGWHNNTPEEPQMDQHKTVADANDVTGPIRYQWHYMSCILCFSFRLMAELYEVQYITNLHYYVMYYYVMQ